MARKFNTSFKRILTECIGISLDKKMINRLGRRLEPLFDINKISGISEKLIIQPMNAAKNAVDYFFSREQEIALITEVVSAGFFGIDGFPITLQNFKILLLELDKLGYSFDKKNRRLVLQDDSQTNPDWGYLEADREYQFCFISVDIADNSKIVRKYPSNKIIETYRTFHNLLEAKITPRDGRIWLWEGDGGIISFHGDNAIQRAVFSILDFTFSLPVFNALYNRLDEELFARIALHPGKAVFKKETGSIKSESLDYVKKMEKEYACPGTMLISKLAWRELGPSLQSFFVPYKAFQTESLYFLDYESGRKPQNG